MTGRWTADLMRNVLVMLLVFPAWQSSFAAEPEEGAKKAPVAELPADVVAEVKASYDEKAPAVVTGVVFVDANANGVRDAGEKGLAGVGVTDGVSINESGEDGSYKIEIKPDATIPWTPARTLSVIWPSEYWPVGRHWRRLSEIPDGKGVDFPLRPDKQSFPFAFSHITDNHGGGGVYPTYAQDLKLLGGMSKFVVDTGDMLYANYSKPGDAIVTYRGLMANIKKADFGVPFFAVIGNHDCTGTRMAADVYDTRHPLFCNGVFTKFLGPIRWSFNYCGAHFIGLDWKRANPDPKGMWESETPQEAVDWFKKDVARLPKDCRVFAFVHFPTGVEEFHKVIGRAAYSFGGHNHKFSFYNYGGPCITSVNQGGQGPSSVGIVTEKDYGIVIRCPGCKARGYHSKLCGIGYNTKGELSKNLGSVRGAPVEVPACDLGSKAVETGGKGIEIEATIEVGTAKRTGLKIGSQEIVFDGEFLHVAGIPIPFKPWPEQNNTLTLHVAASGSMLIVYANDLIGTFKPVVVGDTSKVTFFAEGGTAKLAKGTVRPLKEGVDQVFSRLGYEKEH